MSLKYEPSSTSVSTCDFFQCEIEGLNRCRVNMAQIRQSMPHFGLGFPVKVLKPFGAVPASLGSGTDYFTEMCSGSEAGWYLRLIDFVYHSTLGLRVTKKNLTVLHVPDWLDNEQVMDNRLWRDEPGSRRPRGCGRARER